MEKTEKKMKKQIIKQNKKPLKGGKRKNAKGKFVIPTAEEQAQDRKDHISDLKRQILVDGSNMINQKLNIDARETIIHHRNNQLADNGKIVELFEGGPKPKDMLTAELNIDIFIYKTQISEFEKTKEKFVKVYKFSEDDIIKILNMQFNWSEWAKKDDIIQED